MNIVFLGSSHFAVSALEALIQAGYHISCVETQPDKKKGRHLHLASTDVKLLAQKAGLKVFSPSAINSRESVEFISTLNEDLFVIVAYGQILSQEILDIPKLFSLNIHASLLPKYRGAAPISWAIIFGEEYTGVSIMKVTRKMDSGPVLMQEKVKIGDDDYVVLEDKLRKIGSCLLVKALKQIENNACSFKEQVEKEVVFAPKLKKLDGYIDWSRTPQEIHNLVRGTIPWPGAHTYFKNKLLKIFKSKIILKLDIPANCSSGEVIEVSKDEIIVICGKGALAIDELQLEGGRKMSAKDFIHGHKVQKGYIFGKK